MSWMVATSPASILRRQPQAQAMARNTCGSWVKALNPEHVVPGHGTPGTVKIFEDGEKYYALLLDRVGAMVKAGKSLDDIKKEVKMPEYSGWGSQDRFPTNIEAAYKVVVWK